MPGTPATASRTCWNIGQRASARCRALVRRRSTVAISTRSDSKPMPCEVRPTSVRTNSVDPNTSTNDKRDLQRDECVAHIQPPSAADDAARLIAQGVDRRQRRSAQGRRDAEQQPGHDADAGGERKYTPIHRQIERTVVNARREHRHQRAAAPGGDCQPAQRADHRQHHALDEQLSHQLPPARAERQPQRQFLAASHRLRHQQVRHVGARDRQDQCRRCRAGCRARGCSDRAGSRCPSPPESAPKGSRMYVA